MYDIVIQGGEVIDGGGRERYRADVAVKDGRISAIGEIASQQPAGSTIDARGMVVAPGFIDVHNHSDGWLLKERNFSVKTCQGFTTELLMSDGISYAPVNESTVSEWFLYLRSLNGLEESDYRGWRTIADYMALLDRGTAQNSAAQVPYANVRTMVCGFGSALPNAEQLEQIQSCVREGLEQGAAALSSGLEYLAESFATTGELIAACRPLAEYNRPYVTHIRYPLGLIEGVREAVEIGRKAGVPVHISHLKAPTAELAEALLEFIDKEAMQQVDFSFDVYPYSAASTMLHYLLPYEVWTDGPSGARKKLGDPAMRKAFAGLLAENDLQQAQIAWLPEGPNKQWQGRRLSEFVAAGGAPPQEGPAELVIGEKLSVLLVFHRGDDRVVHPFLAHEAFMLGSDGIYFPDGLPHPRMFGSAARLLGPCVRDHKLFSLEDAVRKMTAIPARRFGLTERGEVREGYWADLAIFDPAAIADEAAYDDPCRPSRGVAHVLVNGVPVVSEGAAIDGLSDPLPGRALHCGLG